MAADIGALVQRLVPNAKYGAAPDYATLAATWREATPVPTEAELEAVRAEVESDQAAQAASPGLEEIVLALLNASSDSRLDALKARVSGATSARTRSNL